MRDAGQGARGRTAVRRSALGIGCAVAALAGVVAAPAGPAGAIGGAPHVRGALLHPERDWMGSSIAAHEGRSTGSPTAPGAATRTQGFDVSNWQGTVDWAAAYSKGARFAYMKATEGTTYKDPTFNANYTHSYNAGFIRGAYHFARPDSSGGKTQADYFVAHGGGWSKDGKTLPPLLDIEYPAGAACYGLSKTAMVSWIKAFVDEVHAKTTRWATIYSTTDWWTTCTGNTASFAAHDPLFVARYASSAGKLPAGWPFYSFWQHADSGTFPGDQDYFNGPLSGLRNLANNT
ncbi:Lyzozyme M1 (1,4-beta-N-acetylmuramidase), GH25 family [Actinacidiphila yanglinensis]|uniref:Lysozyme n=1 Tax=Actinacidiphila yanglinensis TaxID=310779 RepID=A0A1H5ZYM4_9ACTN|nr:lysozyme [Actinacidiphila yanglinensis]SEG40797.1 Lyzozyme M1 (1,4-beta-N-acetylmuramidase), GH25 family [Actinacidiphila yanglinensis]